jgi:hypothetical protein
MSTVFAPPLLLEPPLLLDPPLLLLLLLLPQAANTSNVPASRHPIMALPRKRMLLL